MHICINNHQLIPKVTTKIKIIHKLYMVAPQKMAYAAGRRGVGVLDYEHIVSAGIPALIVYPTPPE
jgi:hypothetical protein